MIIPWAHYRAPHTTCDTHRTYRLKCDEYERLLAIKPGLCHMCGKPSDRLNIDHDHAIGQWAVRGLICQPCNLDLGRIETYGFRHTEESIAYVANPWHLLQDAITARARARAACHVCGTLVAVRPTGTLYTHRRPRETGPSYGLHCLGSNQPATDPAN